MLEEAKNKIAQTYGLLNKTSDSDYLGFDGRFTLDARIDEKLSQASTVTKFYLEDGSNAGDHIIVDPVMLSITGEVGKVTYQQSYLMQGYLKARSQLGSIGIYLPNRTLSQISKIGKTVNQATNGLRKAEDVINKIGSLGAYGEDDLGLKGLKQYTDINSLLGGKKTKNLESDFLAFVKDYVTNRKTLKVDTAKFGRLENMVITNYSLSTNNVDDSTSYTIDLQELRTVKSVSTPVKAISKNTSGDASLQTKDKTDKGVVQGTKKSLFTKITDLF